MRANGDYRRVKRREKAVAQPPERALSKREMAGEYHPCPFSAYSGEHRDHVFQRILRVDHVDGVVAAVRSQLEGAPQYAARTQIKADHRKPGPGELFAERSLLPAGQATVVAAGGIQAHQVLHIFFRAGPPGVADQIDDPQITASFRVNC